jgi:hypothetical protein
MERLRVCLGRDSLFTWQLLVCFLLALITVQAALTVGDGLVPESLLSNSSELNSTNTDKIRSALVKAWWKTPYFSHMAGLRTRSVKGN